MTGIGQVALIMALYGAIAAGSSGMECKVVTNLDSQSIEPILDAFDAWRAAVERGDLGAVVALVTEDAEFWTHSQPALRGRDALRGAMAPLFGDWLLEQTFVCDELIVSGGLAIARGVEVNRLTARGGGEQRVQRQRAFSVLRRGNDGIWRFARGMTTAAPQGP